MSAEAQTTPPGQAKTPDPQTKPADKNTTPPAVASIAIKSAWYGDHETQDRCESWAARSKRSVTGCAFTCDAMEALRVKCLEPLRQQLVYVKTKDGKQATPSKDTPLKVGEELVEVGLANGVMCRFDVSVDLCHRIDPAPDAERKSLKLSFTCAGDRSLHEIHAAEGATVTVHCPQPK